MKFKKIISIFILIIIIGLSFYIYTQTETSVTIVIQNIYVGYVNVNNTAKQIVFEKINTKKYFNITLIFLKNITITFIYTQTNGFSVYNWIYTYNNYTLRGYSQRNFIGTWTSAYNDYKVICFSHREEINYIKNQGILNITIYTSLKNYSGIIAIHVVGNAPSNLIY